MSDTGRKRPKRSIAELEEILNRDDAVPFAILPNGEIRAADPKTIAGLGPKIPLTMRENLGGEYGR